MKFSHSDALSIGQVAWLIGVNKTAVCRAIRMGSLPVVHRRGAVRIPACAVAALADSRNGGASQ